jgi:hypothetical protein
MEAECMRVAMEETVTSSTLMMAVEVIHFVMLGAYADYSKSGNKHLNLRVA